MYLGSCISSTESDVNICLVKVWTASDRLSIIWKSDLSNKIKQDFFQGVDTNKMQKETTQECYELFLTNSGNNTPQNSCMATYHLSQKPFILDKQDIHNTGGEAKTNL